MMISEEVLPVTSMSKEVLQRTMRILPKNPITFDNVIRKDVEQRGVDVVVLQTNDTLDRLKNKDESSSDGDYVHLSEDKSLNDVMYDIIDEMENKEVSREYEDDRIDSDPANVEERVVVTNMPTMEYFETPQEVIHTVLEPNVHDVANVRQRSFDIPFRSDDVREPNTESPNNSPFLVNDPPFLSDTVLVSNAQNVDEGLLLSDSIYQPSTEHVDDTVFRSDSFIEQNNDFLFSELDENINTPLESTMETVETFETVRNVYEPLETTIETVDKPLETTIETVETVCKIDEPFELTVEMLQNMEQVRETTTKPKKRAIEPERGNAHETKGVATDVSQIRKKPKPNSKETIVSEKTKVSSNPSDNRRKKKPTAKTRNKPRKPREKSTVNKETDVKRDVRVTREDDNVENLNKNKEMKEQVSPKKRKIEETVSKNKRTRHKTGKKQRLELSTNVNANRNLNEKSKRNRLPLSYVKIFLEREHLTVSKEHFGNITAAVVKELGYDHNSLEDTIKETILDIDSKDSTFSKNDACLLRSLPGILRGTVLIELLDKVEHSSMSYNYKENPDRIAIHLLKRGSNYYILNNDNKQTNTWHWFCYFFLSCMFASNKVLSNLFSL